MGMRGALLTVGSEEGQRRIHSRDDPSGLRRPAACSQWRSKVPAQAWPAPPLYQARPRLSATQPAPEETPSSPQEGGSKSPQDT